jgi:hypothetical protein
VIETSWIESHQSLREHPKLRKLCKLLDINRMEGIGHLHCLWWWALEYAQDGDLTGYDLADVALGAEWEGEPARFIEALLNCGPGGGTGFLERDTEGGLYLHDWWEYAGKLIEQRRHNAERMRKARAAARGEGVNARATHTPRGVQRTLQARAGHVHPLPTNQPTEPTYLPNQPAAAAKEIEGAREANKTSTAAAAGSANGSGAKDGKVTIQHLERAARAFLGVNPLTPGQQKNIHEWYRDHREGLTLGMVKYAYDQTVEGSKGSKLKYFYAVLERALLNPSTYMQPPALGSLGNGRGEPVHKPAPLWDKVKKDREDERRQLAPPARPMHECGYPGCEVQVYSKYCSQHGDIHEGFNELLPQYRDKQTPGAIV